MVSKLSSKIKKLINKYNIEPSIIIMDIIDWNNNGKIDNPISNEFNDDILNEIDKIISNYEVSKWSVEVDDMGMTVLNIIGKTSDNKTIQIRIF